MGFFEAIRSAFTKYAVFSGRARRSEFWYFQLFVILVALCLSVFALIPFGWTLGTVFALAMLLPQAAVSFRRLHDIGRSGLWWLLSFLPPVGTVILLILCATEGQSGANVYGPDPRAAGYAAPPRPFSVPTPTVAGRAVYVQCLNGSLKGQIFRVGPEGLTLGRDAQCSMRFPDGAQGISRQHCRLALQGGEVKITDLGSTYGTFLEDGRKLPPHYPHTVPMGSCFLLGGQGQKFRVFDA